MVENILKAVINYVVPLILGYCISRIRVYKERIKRTKKNEDIQNIALQTLLKNQLTNTYFVYGELKKIPDYVYQNYLDMLKVYESLGGDGFIHSIAKKMENWDIVKTDIL